MIPALARLRTPARSLRDLLLIALIGATSANGAEGEGIVEHRLEVQGRVRDAQAVDLDGDGLRDLVVLTVSDRGPRTVRRASLFIQRSPRGFHSAPDLVWQLDDEIVALDLRNGPDAPAGAAPIHSLDAAGVREHRFDRQAGKLGARRVLEVESPFLVPPEESVATLDFALGHGDGESAFLLPAFPRPRLYLRGGPDDAKPRELPLQPVATYSRRDEIDRTAASLRMSFEFPQPVTADQDGDGARELLFVERDHVVVLDLPATEGEPLGRRDYPVAILDEERAPKDRFGVQRVRPRLVDLQGDGRLDLVAVAYRDAGFLELEGRVMVFFARQDGDLPRQPDQELQIDHAIYPMTRVIDLDGDGRKEIQIPATKLGLWGYLRLLTSRKVSFTIQTLSLGEDGRYDVERATRDTMTAKLSKNQDFPVAEPADVDGDGRIDLVLGSGTEQVCVHEGSQPRKNRRIQSTPRLCFAADPFLTYVAADLDGDGGAELIRYDPGQAGSAELFVSYLRQAW